MPTSNIWESDLILGVVYISLWHDSDLSKPNSSLKEKFDNAWCTCIVVLLRQILHSYLYFKLELTEEITPHISRWD